MSGTCPRNGFLYTCKNLTYSIDVVRIVFSEAEVAVFSARLVTLVNAATFADTIPIILHVAVSPTPTLPCNTQIFHWLIN